ncbi:MAG: SUMF1/EgtB/PvdO family nonheme iron enzyme [Verrucomicrobiales bacterium]|nr:SUMF1/EgtB/PvdO family nonheme iron enzyme [Verrucomicrobiales bacterium]MCP5527904.1 SUMF1/EgtB/PvdO family nonheme iron enzyme [Verrucomicrobiales bacterium]
MRATGQLLRALPEPSSAARRTFEQNLLHLLVEQGVSPEKAIRHARARLPKIVRIANPPPGVVARLSPATWRYLDQLHHQALTGVSQLRTGLGQPAPRAAAPAPKPPRPAPPSPTPARKPSWLTSGWVWAFLFGILLPAGWIGTAKWAARHAQAQFRDAEARLPQIYAEIPARREAARQLESRRQSLESEAQANLTARKAELDTELAELRGRVNRWEATPSSPALPAGLPAGWSSMFSVPSQDRDAFGNPVVKREGSATDPASGWPWEMVHEASGLVLVLVPAGEFEMGSPANEAGRDSNEGPVHTVRLERPFYLGKYEVTQGQWERVMGNNPSRFKGEARRPVESVSWMEAQGFVSMLNDSLGGAAGLRFALPSEAQWEYGCRAGTTTRFSFGNEESGLGEYGWYTGNGGGRTHLVGGKQPNGWGLYDMHGNVWEWCSDWYGTYSVGAVIDPKGPNTGSHRVYRGGGWSNGARICRSADRYGHAPSLRSSYLGFRMVLVAVP